MQGSIEYYKILMLCGLDKKREVVNINGGAVINIKVPKLTIQNDAIVESYRLNNEAGQGQSGNEKSTEYILTHVLGRFFYEGAELRTLCVYLVVRCLALNLDPVRVKRQLLDKLKDQIQDLSRSSKIDLLASILQYEMNDRQVYHYGRLVEDLFQSQGLSITHTDDPAELASRILDRSAYLSEMVLLSYLLINSVFGGQAFFGMHKDSLIN